MALSQTVWSDSSGDAAAVKSYLQQQKPAPMVLSSEGEFIACFNPEVADWLRRPLTRESLGQLRERLAPHLRIDLSPQGFAPAALREVDGKDETNYDAIWVRDNVWVYYALRSDSGRRADARRLLLALWDYYATEPQRERFKAVIENPSLAQDAMSMPHIRFDGASPTLDDVYENGKPQVWNHRQIDANGLFFTALGEAFADGLLTVADLSPERVEVLSLYPLFLQRIDFANYEDAGAWEEIPRRNTSSIGLATRSLQVWQELANTGPAGPVRAALKATLEGEVLQSWSRDNLDQLIEAGLATVQRQLKLGGESPDYAPDDLHFRRADAALVALIVPSPLQGLSEAEMRTILAIVETLKRPYGILRYHNDSYQGGNYWIRPPAKEGPSATGDTSSREAFLWRLSRLPANSEAQWFFDSLIALARLHLATVTEDSRQASQDRFLAAIHIKRALGQLSGPGQIAADGKPVRAWQAPESINTVILEDGSRHYLASPITPLNWAKAGLDMALRRFADLDG